MPAKRRQYRLPDGTLTTSIARYHRTWVDAALPVERAFPGYRLVSYDPGFLFSDGDDQFVFSWRAVQSLHRNMQSLHLAAAAGIWVEE